jgi:hypothetical protein
VLVLLRLDRTADRPERLRGLSRGAVELSSEPTGPS